MARKGQFQTHCKRGHERIPENMYQDRQCKICVNLRNPEKVKRILEKQKLNPAAHAKRVNDWAKTESGRLSVRNTKLKQDYGITLYDYERMLEAQEGKCAICKVFMDGSTKGLTPCVDHVHTADKHVRGLLCGLCNAGLGLFKDNTDVLYNAIGYLKIHS